MQSSAYLPIEDYGIIGNCRTAALVSKAGSIDRCCFPHFDSPAMFSAILDHERGGSFSITPVQPYRSQQHYVEDTNVLVTTFKTATGEVRLLDCFTVTSEICKNERLWPNHEILRMLEGVSGKVDLELIYHPRPNYGRCAAHMVKRGKLGLSASNGRNLTVLQSDLPEASLVIQDLGQGTLARASFTVAAGGRQIVSLIFDNQAPAVIPPLGASALARFDETVRYWKNWIAACTYHNRYKVLVRRSALALSY